MDDTTGTPGASPEPTPGAGLEPAPAVPAPGGQAYEPPGFVASALTPITPVHPPADDTEDESAGSSAAYHAQDTSGGESGDAQSGSVLRALALAAVERWRKGAGANVKALEVEKAKAQARQIKTAHTINENRVGGTSTTNANKGNQDAKSANTRTHTVNNANQAKSNRDDKNASNRSRDSKNHRQYQGKTSRDDKTAATTADKTSASKDDKNHAAKTSAPKASKDDKNHNTDAHARSVKSSNEAKNQNASASKTASDTKGTKDDQRTTTVHDGDGGKALAPNPKAAKPSAATGPKDSPDKPKDPAQADPKSPAGKSASPKIPAQAGPQEKATKPTGEQTDKPADPKKAADAKGKSQPQPQEQAGQKPSTGEPAATVTAGTEGRPRTQDAREAGYRDGHRTARGVAQVRAYIDGTRDGYADGAEQAAKDKARLDKARDDRKQQRAGGLQPEPAPARMNGDQPVSDSHDVAPIAVKGIDKDRVILGDGAARESMTRGEVRSLKTFERRLKARSEQMIKAADVLKALVGYEKEQARQALALQEKARSVKGGDKLMPTLQRLAEAAQHEAAAAEEAHKQAVRAAEAVKVLLANVEKRDGLIYKAVIDSPETMPAEMAFYKESA